MTEEERTSQAAQPAETPPPEGAATPPPQPAAEAAATTPLGETARPETPGVQQAPPPASPPRVVASDASDEDRLMGALAWVGLAILQIPLVSLALLIAEGNKHRPFQRFHAVNSIIFWVVGFAYEIVALIVYLLLTFISLGCLGIFLWVIFFLPHLAALYYAYQAYQGKRPDIPFISQFARSQGWA